MLLAAIITITLALAFYSVGVWGEKLSGRLSPLYLAFFWAGFVFDTTGTTLMSILSGGLKADLHAVTGALALVLMAIHAVWATVVLVRKEEVWLAKFHRFSLLVWLIWLVPYLIGFLLNL